MSPTSFQTAPSRDKCYLLKRRMGRGGFEPPKQVAADLQSVPFGHSGICPLLQNYVLRKRVMGIEPTYPAWKAGVLPLNYTRKVGVTGFEPATSWSQTRRSSQAEPHPDSIVSPIHSKLHTKSKNQTFLVKPSTD